MARPQWLAFFDDLPDPRIERTRRHLLSDILLIVLVGAVCQCRGWDDTRDFIENGPPELRALMQLPNGVPCADTLRRVLGALDPRAFSKAFTAWANGLCQTTEGKLVSIDGKTVRGAQGRGQAAALHLINAWVSDNSIVLGQLATDIKENEITAIPQLIELLDLRGAVVSIDAIGCQKSIAAKLRLRGADYLFGLKKNHPTLHKEVLESFDQATCAQLEQSEQTYWAEADKAHGRLEQRRLWVQTDIRWLTRSESWDGLQTLVLIESERTIRGKTSCERRAYLSSLQAPAKRFFDLVRGHWHIENRLHWVLDTTFGEDRVRIDRRNGAENLALIRKVALNLLQQAPSLEGHSGTLRKIRWASRRFDCLLSVLTAGAQDI